MSVKATAAAMRVANWKTGKKGTGDRLLLFKFGCTLEVKKERQVMDTILRLGRNHQPAF